jgi:hypothetical protein
MRESVKCVDFIVFPLKKYGKSCVLQKTEGQYTNDTTLPYAGMIRFKFNGSGICRLLSPKFEHPESVDSVSILK